MPSGKVYKYGDNVDTDVIIPARYLNAPSPDELAKHCMEDIDATFAQKVQPGDIIVGGANFGCGSSREQAAEVLVANGILMLECQDLADHVKEGDIIQVDLDNQKITADGKTYAIPAIPENLYHIIMDGGLVKSIMKKVEKGLL